MRSWSAFIVLWFAGLAACLLPAPAIANTSHHHIGGGGGGADTDADCLRWGYLTADGAVLDGPAPDSSPGASADGAAGAPGSSDAGNDLDAGGADAAPPPDGGSASGAAMVCLEHATLFGCDCATTGSAAWPTGVAMASMVVLGLGVCRRRSARRRRNG